MASKSKGSDIGSTAVSELPICFVIMPISDPDGYPAGHFKRVFEDIFVPACERAGFKPVRADQIRATNLIHLDVLQKLLESPLALCDLSSRNPNVMFELGLRQAFDRPVVLVQEAGTPQIFDIAPLRYTEYRRGRIYHEVLEDHDAIAEAIRDTMKGYEQNEGVNSLVKILSLTRPASLVEVQEADKDPALQIIRAELNDLRLEFREAIRATRRYSEQPVEAEVDAIVRETEVLDSLIRRSVDLKDVSTLDQVSQRLVLLKASAIAMSARRPESKRVHFRMLQMLDTIKNLEGEIRLAQEIAKEETKA